MDGAERWRTAGLGFTRQKSLVRTQHRPLVNSNVLQEKRKRQEEAGYESRPFLHQQYTNGVARALLPSRESG